MPAEQPTATRDSSVATIAWPGPVAVDPTAPTLVPPARARHLARASEGPKTNHNYAAAGAGAHSAESGAGGSATCSQSTPIRSNFAACPETNEWALGLAAAKQYAYGAAAVGGASSSIPPTDRGGVKSFPWPKVARQRLSLLPSSSRGTALWVLRRLTLSLTCLTD